MYTTICDRPVDFEIPVPGYRYFVRIVDLCRREAEKVRVGDVCFAKRLGELVDRIERTWTSFQDWELG